VSVAVIFTFYCPVLCESGGQNPQSTALLPFFAGPCTSSKIQLRDGVHGCIPGWILTGCFVLGLTDMPIFSRPTILAATDLLVDFGHAALTRFLLEFGLDDIGDAGSLRDRANATARYLLRNPDAIAGDGENLTDSVVSRLIHDEIRRHTDHTGFHFDRFSTRYADLQRALDRDGFTVEDGQLRRTLPAALDLPGADDEVHALLDQYGYVVPRGHLDQAVAAHARGDWAAANAQLRAFTESLLDHIAATLTPPGVVVPPVGHQRRQWLAHIHPPFFIGEINEWQDDGRGFIEAFYRRLHPQGAHPGLSDEEDSTFRLHLVLLTARLLLRRLVNHGR
jgi:hypothetical protein